MKRYSLGEFEEIVLLTVGVLFDNAYAVSITEELRQVTGRKTTISAVHTALYRLEEKGYLSSRMGESEARRGGKRKRCFNITPLGKRALDEAQSVRISLRNRIPRIAFEF